MCILAIVGSQRKKGNTARLVQMMGTELEALAERAGHAASLRDALSGRPGYPCLPRLPVVIARFMI